MTSHLNILLASVSSDAMVTGILERIEKTLEVVRHSPHMGTPREQLTHGLRVTFYHSYQGGFLQG